MHLENSQMVISKEQSLLSAEGAGSEPVHGTLNHLSFPTKRAPEPREASYCPETIRPVSFLHKATGVSE